MLKNLLGENVEICIKFAIGASGGSIPACYYGKLIEVYEKFCVLEVVSHKAKFAGPINFTQKNLSGKIYINIDNIVYVYLAESV